MTSITQKIVICGFKRTPICNFQGALNKYSAVDLGVFAVKGLIEAVSSNIGENISELIYSSSLLSNQGQNPAKQVSLRSGLKDSVISSTVNKVCASGTKALINACNSLLTDPLALREKKVVVVVGSESMSSCPYFVNRRLPKFGGSDFKDSLMSDGLLCGSMRKHMGKLASISEEREGISLAQCNDYAVGSYRKALSCDFSGEIVAVDGVSEDEAPKMFNEEKMRGMRAVLGANITAGNASKISDGAAALLVTTREAAAKLGLEVLASLDGYGEAELAPDRFIEAPALAIEKTMQAYGIAKESVDCWEINEAFSSVPILTAKKLGIAMDRVNSRGGAISLGHPLGCSGVRIVGSLLNSLQAGKTGCAAICNGGGGGSCVFLTAE